MVVFDHGRCSSLSSNVAPAATMIEINARKQLFHKGRQLPKAKLLSLRAAATVANQRQSKQARYQWLVRVPWRNECLVVTVMGIVMWIIHQINFIPINHSSSNNCFILSFMHLSNEYFVHCTNVYSASSFEICQFSRNLFSGAHPCHNSPLCHFIL